MKESKEIERGLKQAERVHTHIHFLGEHSNATDYLHASDFFCLSSIYEGMPITLIESFATGCIPICTPVGGIPEMVEELDQTLLAKSVKGGDYVQALRYGMAITPEKQEGIKKQSVSLFKNEYSIEYCAKQYDKLYKNMLNGI
jgi:glycosyltransferase involved in cell wall biosynthesis